MKTYKVEILNKRSGEWVKIATFDSIDKALAEKRLLKNDHLRARVREQWPDYQYGARCAREERKI